MNPVLIQMWHSLALGLGLASIVIAVLALLGTLYALAFAVVGIVGAVTRKKMGSLRGCKRETPDDSFSGRDSSTQ